MCGAAFKDGSGLNRDDRLTADLLTALLAKAADPAHPELRPVLTGLPVGGFTGTLPSRYADGAAGVVRAKTGTLTGVNTLAGTVVDQDGRLLAFAFLAIGHHGPRVGPVGAGPGRRRPWRTAAAADRRRPAGSRAGARCARRRPTPSDRPADPAGRS